MVAYYNENDPYAAAWLRNLIAAGRIPWGYVDERDIRDVAPADLAEYSQCHFFAGIGGWPLALALAGVPTDRPLWTGSCPCQPFSTAGNNQGVDDPRHLWPAWFILIRECRPPIVLGEQVPSAIAHGWLDGVFDDLEGEGYACGAIIAPAVSVGAPHIRDRLWFVADADGERKHGRPVDAEVAAVSQPAPVADTDTSGSSLRRESQLLAQREAPVGSGWWAAEPSVGRVAHGVPARVGRLRAYGNAIVPPLAAEFIKAYLDC